MSYHSSTKSVLVAISILIGASIAHYYFQRSKIEGPIRPFEYAHDANDFKNLFIKNHYWLTTREYKPEHLEFILTTLSPNEYEPEYRGKMKIDVLKEHDQLI